MRSLMYETRFSSLQSAIFSPSIASTPSLVHTSSDTEYGSPPAPSSPPIVDERGRPVLRIQTTLRKAGAGMRYRNPEGDLRLDVPHAPTRLTPPFRFTGGDDFAEEEQKTEFWVGKRIPLRWRKRTPIEMQEYVQSKTQRTGDTHSSTESS